MTAAFDHIAQDYDKSFTHSPVGKMQRMLVLNYLQKVLEQPGSLNILELNCGTGEDAIWFAQRQQTVLATDISAQMIEVARNKLRGIEAGENIRFEVMDILQSAKILEGQKFDIVFSNFGGLNCLDPHHFSGWLRNQMPSLLKPDGKFIAVLMPDFCVWETIYFLSKFRFRNAFRRQSNGPVEGKLSNTSTVNTWYYNPRWVEKHLAAGMKVTNIKPIGVFIPPSCLNHFFSKRPKFLQLLEKMEKRIGKVKACSFLSDHYLIEIQPVTR